jgi:ribosomal protein S18 acetylase RimI-like enzyme
MVGQEEGVVNYEEQRAAVLGRLLPGAQIASIGSPYASTGPAHERYVEFFGRPGNAVCIIKAPGWAMNPVFWTPERCAKLKEDDPDVYRTDCAAEFADADDSFFAAEEIYACTRKEPRFLDPQRGVEYVAAMDPATRGNAWTLVIVGLVHGKYRVFSAREWVGSKSEPLSPEIVVAEVAEECRRYGIATVLTDQAMADALRDLSRRVGLHLVERSFSSAKSVALYSNLRLRMQAGEVELPPDRTLREDLLRVRRRASARGASIHLPVGQNGRHCDYAPSLVLAMSRWLFEREPTTDPTDEERTAEYLRKTVRKLQKRYGQGKSA